MKFIYLSAFILLILCNIVISDDRIETHFGIQYSKTIQSDSTVLMDFKAAAPNYSDIVVSAAISSGFSSTEDPQSGTIITAFINSGSAIDAIPEATSILSMISFLFIMLKHRGILWKNTYQSFLLHSS